MSSSTNVRNLENKLLELIMLKKQKLQQEQDKMSNCADEVLHNKKETIGNTTIDEHQDQNDDNVVQSKIQQKSARIENDKKKTLETGIGQKSTKLVVDCMDAGGEQARQEPN